MTDSIWQHGLRTALRSRTEYRGDVELLAIPAALDFYLSELRELFDRLGRKLNDAELEQLRQLLWTAIDGAFALGSANKVVVHYVLSASTGMDKNLALNVTTFTVDLNEQYRLWLEQRQSQPFGAHPDARVVSLLEPLGTPAAAPVLDVGAGTGRNAIYMAQRGFPVDAVEATPVMLANLQQAIGTIHVPLEIIAGNVLDPELRLCGGHYALIVASEVAPHFRRDGSLERMIERCAAALRSDGRLVLNLFLARDDYAPDALAEQLSETLWSTIYTRGELRRALQGLPLVLESDDSAYEYEWRHLPSFAWPPTSWFEAWARCEGLFLTVDPAQLPVELRWIVLRKAT